MSLVISCSKHHPSGSHTHRGGGRHSCWLWCRTTSNSLKLACVIVLARSRWVSRLTFSGGCSALSSWLGPHMFGSSTCLGEICGYCWCCQRRPGTLPPARDLSTMTSTIDHWYITLDSPPGNKEVSPLEISNTFCTWTYKCPLWLTLVTSLWSTPETSELYQLPTSSPTRLMGR